MYLEIEVPQYTLTPDWALLIEIVYKQTVWVISNYDSDFFHN